jgi:hypothetical protein
MQFHGWFLLDGRSGFMEILIFGKAAGSESRGVGAALEDAPRESAIT